MIATTLGVVDLTTSITGITPIAMMTTPSVVPLSLACAR
jgi:hypothetical protein